MERKTYTVPFLLSKMNSPVEPIANMVIPNITIPASLQSRRKTTQMVDSIETNIRTFFNSVTSSNLEKICEEFFILIVEKAQTTEMLDKVAIEMFENFLINESNINNYMVLLNKVHRCAVAIDDKTSERKISPTIGFFFLEQCRKTFFENIELKKIKEFASLNQDDEDELDTYNRERERLLNLESIIASLYQQRGSGNLCLNEVQVSACLSKLVRFYLAVLERYESYLDPETGDSKDEYFDENEVNRKMLILYGELIHTLLLRAGSDLIKEERVKKDLVTIEERVVPSLMNDYLIACFKKLKIN